MANLIVMLSVLVLAGVMCLNVIQQGDALSMLSSDENTSEVGIKQDQVNALKPLKRMTRSDMVFEIFINLGKTKKRKKGKNVRGRKRKTSRRRSNNRRSRRRYKSKVQKKRRRISKKSSRRRHRNKYHVINIKRKKQQIKRNRKKSRKSKPKKIKHGNHYHYVKPKPSRRRKISCRRVKSDKGVTARDSRKYRGGRNNCD